MKIVAVLGSPRPQGNRASLARQFLAAARELGAEVQEYPLNQLDFQGCQGCRTCKTKSEACVLEDDLAEVLAAIKGADLLVLASPVYFGDIIGQMKCFFDRTYSFLTRISAAGCRRANRRCWSWSRPTRTRPSSPTSSPATSAG